MQSRVPVGPGKFHVVVLVEEGVTSEDERITENLNSGDEIKPRYLETTGSIVGWVTQGVLNLEKGISALDEKTWPG